LPTTSLDTFFACTVIIAAALISTAFLASTLQNTIAQTQDINKKSYLQAIADNIVINPGAPLNWGSSTVVPSSLGLATSDSTFSFELDLDKIGRLNFQNTYSLSYPEMLRAAKMNDFALGITLSQILAISIEQTSNSTVGDDFSSTFSIITSINSKPASAVLQCYIAANSYIDDFTNITSSIGVGHLTIHMPTSATNDAILILFARSCYDDRITSYAIYNFQTSKQERVPGNGTLHLTPLNYVLCYSINSSNVVVEDGCLFAFSGHQNLGHSEGNTQFSIPRLIDKSPFIVVVCGLNGDGYFQEWAAYPQVPLKAGSSFDGSEQNVFTYTVTVKDTFYKLEISLGEMPA
jgi:hypothetical protein